jgi:hypothetical protein
MWLQKVISRKNCVKRSITKIEGSGSGSEPGARSGSISQRHGSADPDPDPPQNVMDPQHCQKA